MSKIATRWDQALIDKLKNGCGTAIREEIYEGNNKITIFRLANHKVRDNFEFLTDKQKIKLFELIVTYKQDFLDSLSFQTLPSIVDGVTYYVPVLVCGRWPHCDKFAIMDETGTVFI